MNLREWMELQPARELSVTQQKGITWGVYRFSEPVNLVSSLPSVLPPNANTIFRVRVPGLYVIMVEDAKCQPRPFRALYFGQSDDVMKRADSSHENYLSWCFNAEWKPLYVSYHEMYGSTKEQREAVETILIEHYRPVCNKKISMNFYEALFRT